MIGRRLLFAMSAALLTMQAAAQSNDVIKIAPRYYNWTAPEGVAWTETNTGFDSLDWEIPVDQAAIVLVDVWEKHYLEDTQARIDSIINGTIAPLVFAARQAGLKVIHTPGPRKALMYPDHIWEPSIESEPPQRRGDREWPPREFRQRRGEFAAYSKPASPPSRAETLRELRSTNRIHSAVEPIAGEPVIRNGQDLHEYLKQEGILFLFYVGFHPNACIITRDYGALLMGQRGYSIVLLRDAGTAMEAAHTQARMEQTHNAYLMLEMFGHYTSTAAALMDGLPQTQ